MTAIRKLLIANRGEIAVRIIRACRELGITAVAVYSEADHDALHVRLADEAYPIGPAPAVDSYLRVEAILAAAQESGADAVHPGYGFLSERAHFAAACEHSGLTWVGPPAAAIDLLGSKIAAKRLAIAHDVPVVPGYDGDDQRLATLQSQAERIGFPLLIKASAGGGGRGMRVVRSAAEFHDALESARREARAAFGDDLVLLEKLIERPRHVEFQIIADHHGAVVHLGERECSIQRRHQKLVEEAPCIALDDSLRVEMGAAAVRLARAAGYRNAGTVEFMLDPAGQPYFLEVNTRLQVEHPVTEFVTGYDLVHLQLAVAAGQPLPFTQDEVRLRGHAVEVRVNAEDPATFLPAIGPILDLVAPDGPGIRNDLGVAAGDTATVYYDPLIAKLIVHAGSRPAALARLRRALDDYALLGLPTSLPLLRAIVEHPDYVAGATHTAFLDETGLAASVAAPPVPPEVLAAAALASEPDATAAADPFAVAWRATGAARRLHFESAGASHAVAIAGDPAAPALEIDGRPVAVELVARRGSTLTLRFGARQERIVVAAHERAIYLHCRGAHYRLDRAAALTVDALDLAAGAASGHSSLEAPMSGTLLKVLVQPGQTVAAREPLVILEAMKMEHTIVAPHPGIVAKIHFTAGQLVPGGAVLVEIDAHPTAPSDRI